MASKTPSSDLCHGNISTPDPALRRSFRPPSILLLLVALLFPCISSANALGDLAASMSPGEWRVLATNGLNQSLLTDGNDSILNYSPDAEWDSTTRQFLYYGSGHPPASGSGKLIVYSADTNSWRAISKPFTDGTHTYHYNALSVARRTFYHMEDYDTDLWAWNIDTGTWTQRARMYPGAYYTSEGSIEYHPGMDRLLGYDGKTQEVSSYNPATNTWTRLTPDGLGSSYHNYMRFNPVYNVCVFGGGNGENRMYKITAAGTITQVANAPVNIGTNNAIITVDPVGGEYLVFANDSTFRAYNVNTNTWRTISGGAPALFAESWSPASNGIAAAPVSNYGVVMFLVHSGGAGKVLIYKHSDGPPPDTLPPVPPPKFWKQ